MNPSTIKRQIVLDLGTTTLLGQLLSPTGEVLAEHKVANPQREIGADILLRLQKAHEGGGVALQSLVVMGLQEVVNALLALSGCSAGDISSVVAAGNPGMSCLLRNLPVDALLFPPHKPPCKELACLPVDEIDLGLAVPLQLFPSVSGFVGGDLVACLLALKNVQPGTLMIDVGTNAELALWDGASWHVTSAAAGPAFECGNISSGMVMAEGAVTDVRLVGDNLHLTVVGGATPQGLCGSGLAALVAVARQGGLVDENGRILSPDDVETNLGRYLVEKSGAWAIRFHHSATGDLLLTQVDLRNFQFAKGAVRAGIRVLLERCGLTHEDVPQVLITGALGKALPVEVLKRVALLPEPMLDKTSFVANAVLAGLQTYLVSADGQQRLADLTNTIRSFPLSGTPAFEKLFLGALEF